MAVMAGSRRCSASRLTLARERGLFSDSGNVGNVCSGPFTVHQTDPEHENMVFHGNRLQLLPAPPPSLFIYKKGASGGFARSPTHM